MKSAISEFVSGTKTRQRVQRSCGATCRGRAGGIGARYAREAMCVCAVDAVCEVGWDGGRSGMMVKMAIRDGREL